MSRKRTGNIFESTDAFEAWMRKRTDVSKRLLKKKHGEMANGPFPFLRSTFYRWAEQWPSVCPELAGRASDVLLAVGDLHVANFGVWCDNRRRQVVRIPDPFFQVHDRWLIRQLAPDIAKIDMPRPRDQRLARAPDLLRLMGRETANIHLGSRTNQDLGERLDSLDRHLPQWFPLATDRMVASVRKDHAKWAERYRD
jgi:hypothetical protein